MTVRNKARKWLVQSLDFAAIVVINFGVALLTIIFYIADKVEAFKARKLGT